MPDQKVNSVARIQTDEVREARLDAEAMVAAAEGRVVPHEEVREWLTKLAKGERVPRPRG
jgi:predicted transcriptional regulator